MNDSNEVNQRQALTRRVQRRIECEGKIVLPAVPGMQDDYLSRCEKLFAAVGRQLNQAERDRLRQVLAKQLSEAFSRSNRSTITISYIDDPVERPKSLSKTERTLAGEGHTESARSRTDLTQDGRSL